MLAAARLDHLPRVVRAQVCEALVTAARVAGLLEGLSEGFVTTATQEQSARHEPTEKTKERDHAQDQE